MMLEMILVAIVSIVTTVLTLKVFNFHSKCSNCCDVEMNNNNGE